MLYLDPFSELDFRRLDAIRADHCVSIYIPTHTVSRETEQDKILFKNGVRKAMSQLSEAGADKRRVSGIEARLQALADDTLFWNHLAESLAVLATPDAIETYRLPRAVSVEVEVSDRFHLKPLIPLLAFPHTAYVLDIAQNQVRFWSVTEGRKSRCRACRRASAMRWSSAREIACRSICVRMSTGRCVNASSRTPLKRLSAPCC
jgi:hypothetical protein